LAFSLRETEECGDLTNVLIRAFRLQCLQYAKEGKERSREASLKAIAVILERVDGGFRW
jgi:hypothetical protein